MQSLERILSAPTGRGEVDSAREKPQGHSAPDDFGRLMQRALASKSKDSPHGLAARAERKQAASGKNSVRAEVDPTGSSPKKISSPAAGKSAIQTSTEPAFTHADGTLWPSTALIDAPPPSPLPLPQSACFVSQQTQADFSAASKVNSDLAAAPLKEGEGGAASVAGDHLKLEKTAEENSTPLAAALAPSKDLGIVAPQNSEPAKTEAATATDARPDNMATAGMPKPAAGAESMAGELAAAASPAPEIGGTGVATGEVPMKKNANTNKVAGLDGTVLPGDAARSAREKVLPTPALAGPVRAAENNSGETSINLTLRDTFGSVEISAAQTLAILPSLTDARMRNLERTHDMVALHAVRLLEAQTDTLSVVIKPGAGTELSLELRQRNGSIEAHAVLSRGDFQLMNQHWPELQQRLEQRGIKLAPLGGEAGFSTDSGSGFKQQQQSSRELEAQKASAFAEFALAGRTLGATARLAVGGWESWA